MKFLSKIGGLTRGGLFFQRRNIFQAFIKGWLFATTLCHWKFRQMIKTIQPHTKNSGGIFGWQKTLHDSEACWMNLRFSTSQALSWNNQRFPPGFFWVGERLTEMVGSEEITGEPKKGPMVFLLDYFCCWKTNFCIFLVMLVGFVSFSLGDFVVGKLRHGKFWVRRESWSQTSCRSIKIPAWKLCILWEMFLVLGGSSQDS